MSQTGADLPARIDTLHIVNKTPAHSRVTQCVAALMPTDTVLLIENGVLGAGDYARSAPCPVFVLAADARARGVGALSKSGSGNSAAIHCVDYAQMVQLSALATRIISW